METPWWFAGTIGLVGVVAGVLLKWLADTMSERERRRREDQIRFAAEKQAAYVRFLFLADEMARARVTTSVNEQFMRTESFETMPPDRKEEFRQTVNENRRIVADGLEQLREHMQVIHLLAPAEIGTIANQCATALLVKSRDEFQPLERKFLELARQDLGVSAPV